MTQTASNQERVYTTVLSIAGSDSCGGAGIQADLKTIAASGCYGMSVITAITAQNTQGVSGIYPIDPAFVAQQIDAVFTDVLIGAVKIGMLYSADLIKIIADKLAEYNAKNVVLDPVMIAQSGDALLKEDAVEALVNHLFPIAHIVTPNIPEAECLLNRKIDDVKEMARAARDLIRHGSTSVLIKGGHFDAETCPDMLYISGQDKFVRFETKRINTTNNHGTGCTLSSAIAAYLAKGESLPEAVKRAKHYTTSAIEAGVPFRLGSGHGPVHHFYESWKT